LSFGFFQICRLVRKKERIITKDSQVNGFLATLQPHHTFPGH
jgi:hypothetical protein